MKVLVTGAKGMLGQDLCPILEDNNYNVIETDINTLDITNAFNVNSVLNEEKPNILIHCAAYTNVDLAESELEKARLINAKGTENLADLHRHLSLQYTGEFNDLMNVQRKGVAGHAPDEQIFAARFVKDAHPASLLRGAVFVPYGDYISNLVI